LCTGLVCLFVRAVVIVRVGTAVVTSRHDPQDRKPMVKGLGAGQYPIGATRRRLRSPSRTPFALRRAVGQQPSSRHWTGTGVVPVGLVDGRFAPKLAVAHQNPLYKQQTSPLHKVWAPGSRYNKLPAVGARSSRTSSALPADEH